MQAEYTWRKGQYVDTVTRYFRETLDSCLQIEIFHGLTLFFLNKKKRRNSFFLIYLQK